jgi:hypothetical protein
MRPNSSKTFRLRGNVGGISTKSFISASGIMGDDLGMNNTMKPINMATTAIAMGNRMHNFKDGESRALALKKQNEQLKKMIGEDKLTFLDSNLDGNKSKNSLAIINGRTQLNPIKNPPRILSTTSGPSGPKKF